MKGTQISIPAPPERVTAPAPASAHASSSSHLPGRGILHRLIEFSTTPQKINALVCVILLCCVCNGLSGVMAAIAARSAFTTIFTQAIPNIVQAHETRAGLAELDTAAANEFLTISVSQTPAFGIFDQRRDAALTRLLATANDHSINTADLDHVKNLMLELERYLALVQKARAFEELHNPQAATILLQASDLMHEKLLSSADAFVLKKQNLLTKVYPQLLRKFDTWTSVALCSGIALLLVLLLLQVYLLRKTNRICNPLIFLSTFTFAVSLLLFNYWSQEALRSLDYARFGAYEQVNAIWSARSAANEANWYESICLLKNMTWEQYRNTFQKSSNQVKEFGFTKKHDTQVSDADEIERYYQVMPEQQEVTKVQAEWEDYLQIDREIRRLEDSRLHKDAVALCLGTKTDQSEGKFKTFNDHLSRLLSDQETRLREHKNDGRVADYCAYLLPIIVGLVALMVWAGLKPRMKEYGA